MTSSWTVAEQLRWVVGRRPSATALVDADGELTFARFGERVQALAGFLAPYAGGRVGLYLANRREWAEAFFACQLAGIGVVPVNDRYQDREVRHLVADAGISLLVSDAAGHRGDVLAGLRGDVDILLVGAPYEAALAAGGPVRRRANDESAVLYTSGTTALPKGVRLTQANQALGTFLGPAVLLGLTAADTVLIPTPLGHRVGQVRLLGGLLTGARTVLSADARPATLLEAVRRHAVTVTGMVPTIARDLALSGTPVGEQLASLRVLSVTGEAMTAELRGTVARMLPGTELWTFFASTETGMAAALPPEQFTARPGSSGRALPGVELAVRDLETGARASTGSGEVLVRSGAPGSYAVGAGYVGAAADTAFTDAEGWFATGDLGTLDAEGWLSITGRSKDMILSGGFNIAAQEVEEVLRLHPGVRDVAVTGEPDERFGERVVAWVVRTPGSGDRVDAEELRAFTGTHVAAFKRPRVVRFVDELPRTATGKTAKWRLGDGAGR
ncbi:class I adenylate-forming enzyme family protein [Modestobacter sp. NPDC049651]|uniref:class I adenylate-forming enzyme family protein n=1 Tax=unclassified Modestobacter TaxID=2643866 RepID=UPI0033C4B519